MELHKTKVPPSSGRGLMHSELPPPFPTSLSRHDGTFLPLWHSYTSDDFGRLPLLLPERVP